MRPLGLFVSLVIGLAGCGGGDPSDDFASGGDALTDPEPTAAPRQLVCLARHFVGAPKATSAGWVLALPAGDTIPWNDGKEKSFDEKLASADLEDTLSIPYRGGPIVAVTRSNDDPGRIRNDALYRATYGATKEAVLASLVPVEFVGQEVKFHPRAAAALSRVAQRLSTAIAAKSSLGSYVTGELGGTFNWRVIANTPRLSAHSFGTAIDIVVAKSDYWEWQKGALRWKNQVPQAIVDAFEAEGFAWGGRWYHYDTMHFEYRPELFDQECAP